MPSLTESQQTCIVRKSSIGKDRNLFWQQKAWNSPLASGPQFAGLNKIVPIGLESQQTLNRLLIFMVSS